VIENQVARQLLVTAVSPPGRRQGGHPTNQRTRTVLVSTTPSA